MINITRDEEGYLLHLFEWNTDVARDIAEEEGITLTESHWEIITHLRAFYSQFSISPAMRPLTKYLKEKIGKETISSIYLLQLFPGSPAKLAAKIAGLPKPDNCL